MTFDIDGQRLYAYDAIQAEFSFDTDDSVTTDDRGTQIWWDAQRSVSADDVPSYYNDFFDAERYFAIDTVVAKSIPQEYRINDEHYTALKPNDELQKAVWSLDGKPYTLTHPSQGAVRSTNEIHGFWGQPRHDSDKQESWATLYFPTHDSEAREFVAEHDNVSVGFINTFVASDRDDIDLEQHDLYYDHVASVKKGRCSDDDGCGLQNFAMDEITEIQITADNEIDIHNDTNTMTCDCDGDMTDGGLKLDVGDFGVSKIRTENDAVDTELAQKEDRIEELESKVEDSSEATELLSAVESRVCGDDADVSGEDLLSEIESLQDSYADIQEEMESYRADERDELLDALKERTDSEHHEKFSQDEDETVTDHISRLEESLETLKMVKQDSSPTTVSPTQTDSASDASTNGKSEFSSESGAVIDGSQFANFDDF